MGQPNPYILAADNPTALLALLRDNQPIASCQDEHGYSLLHAASSYGHVELLRALVKDFNVDVNLTDEDGETCLFVAESLEVAKALVEELGVDYNKRNHEGMTACQSMASDDSFPQIAAYLKALSGDSSEVVVPSAVLQTDILNPPPPLPSNIQVNLGTVSEQELNAGVDDVDPEFKRRIDELAARDDFQSEATQSQLRELVLDAIQGANIEARNRDVRQRTG